MTRLIWADLATVQAEAERWERRVRYARRESARRRALFTKAERVLATAAAMAGSKAPLIAVQAWHDAYGRRQGLYIILPGDREMAWTPRGGFNVGEISYGKIPF